MQRPACREWPVRPRLAFQTASIVVTLAALEAPAAAQSFFDWFGGRHDDRYPQRQNSWSGGQRQEPAAQPQGEYTPQGRAYRELGAGPRGKRVPGPAPYGAGAERADVARLRPRG